MPIWRYLCPMKVITDHNPFIVYNVLIWGCGWPRGQDVWLIFHVACFRSPVMSEFFSFRGKNKVPACTLHSDCSGEAASQWYNAVKIIFFLMSFLSICCTLLGLIKVIIIYIWSRLVTRSWSKQHSIIKMAAGMRKTSLSSKILGTMRNSRSHLRLTSISCRVELF